MEIKFDIEKFVNYLDRYKSELPSLYSWNTKIERLAELQTLTSVQIEEINALPSYEKELLLKKIVGQKLRDTYDSDRSLFNQLCLWIIKDWGGIKTARDNDTISLISEFLNQEKPDFKRIASASKVGAYLYPEQNVIYDSRVAYTVNWIILSENAGSKFFPIPEGRNSKMSAFDMNVLIRLKNISVDQTEEISRLDHRLFIKNSDKELFINKKDAYSELNKLILQINEKLWKGDKEKERKLYFTEMLLFSIADREVIMDIMKKYAI